MKSRLAVLNLLLFYLVTGCGEKQNRETLYVIQENTGINFENKVTDGSKENSFLFRNFYNGGGVAIGDINNDGLADVFLTSNAGANKLYLNKGDFKFEDISGSAGIIPDDKWNTGVTFADVNNDGWLDIYVCSSGHMGTGTRKNKLYINNRDLTFSEEADQYGLGISAYTTQVSFFDYDLDGDLDCFMINNSPIPINQLNFANRRDLPDSLWKIADFLKGGGDHLYRNDHGVFKEITHEAGIHGGLISFGLGVSVGDINQDGWPDVYVSNDSYERDYLYINQQDGTFKDELEEWFQHTSFSSMGADIADINNDGAPDLFTTDMLPLDDYRLKTTGSFDNISLFNSKLKSGFYYQYTKNCLQLNNGNGKFIDIARYANPGIAATDWSWGALIFDMDNDGWNDLYVCNGVNRDVTNLDFMDFFANEVIQKMVMTGKKDDIERVLKEIPQTPVPNKVFRNDHDLRFTDAGAQWGFDMPTLSNGAAYGDLDNDGDLDLIINNENQPAVVYKNRSRELNKNNYLAVRLKKEGGNTFAVGSEVKVYTGGQVLSRELIPSRGFQSSVDYKLLFGLGKQEQVDSLVIQWPGRKRTVIKSPVINSTLLINQDSVQENAIRDEGSRSSSPAFFQRIQAPYFEKHTENSFIDFYTERGIPRVLSREGPKAAVADINGDGQEDIFIGGGKGYPAQVYLQGKGGAFIKKEEPALDAYPDFEDVASLFFDCDGDRDMDLLVCPGGNESSPGSRELQLRLYKNDGQGNFTIDVSSLPPTGTNISVAIDHDFNGDGFPDLFIGSRNSTGQYGITPPSFLFQNDGKGKFTDVTDAIAPEIRQAGMITGAVWADVTGDQAKELVLVGEWMAPRIFSVDNGRFREVKTSLSDMYGWWQTVAVADLNNDGKQDLVLANIGENFYLRPDKEHPVKLWINDFDKNDNYNKLISYTINGKDMPVFLKHDLEDQLPVIKKNKLKHEQYARSSVQDLFSPELISSSVIKQFNYASSCLAINEGNNRFRIEKLPPMTQMSCINAVLPVDVNNDGFTDLVTAGNQFGFLPQFEKMDASFGDVLINDGKGGFTCLASGRSGLMVRGEARDIKSVMRGGERCLLFLQNDDYPVFYRENTVKQRE